MKILKFGGVALSNFEAVLSIVGEKIRRAESFAVVVSAFEGVTDKLIEANLRAGSGDTGYKQVYEEICRVHRTAAEQMVNGVARANTTAWLQATLQDLGDVLHGFSLARDKSLRTLDLIMSFGERLAAHIVSQAIASRYQTGTFVDARELIITDDSFGAAREILPLTEKKIKAHFAQAKGPQIVAGFIGATEQGETTTLGRGGSDYTAALLASALKADEIELWTTVNGFMTADPAKVKTALTIAKLHYDEGLELAQFGARIVHPLAIQRAALSNIPIRIRNVLFQEFAGSLISTETQREHSVTGVSSIGDVSLLLLEGLGIDDVTELARRFFAALGQARCEVLLTSQGCAQHALCVAVRPEQELEAVSSVQREFSVELQRKEVELTMLPKHSVVAVVGLNMQHSPGTSGKFFQTLGRNGINVVTIAQGSSELNISAVIAQKDESKALNAIHEAFFLAEQKTLNLFVIGVGSVGSKLLEQIAEQSSTLRGQRHLNIRIVALANSKHVLFSADGLSLTQWREHLKNSPVQFHLPEFISLMKEANLPNSIFVDCTASKDVAQKYDEVLRASISIVTPNKKANAGSLAHYHALQHAAAKANVKFFYETNVGAGLPVIGTLNDLISSGDEIVKIEAVLSGTLSYIFNSFRDGTKFSSIVKEARTRGYTEPDPRDDLSGMDVARKLLILGREMGLPLEEDAVSIESLIPKNCRHAKTVDEFFVELERADGEYEQRRKAAADRGEVLRYIGVIADGKAAVSLHGVDSSHPFFSLSGSDNIISFTTKRYNERPLVVKGPGAGTDVTAAGILADILRVSSYLT